MKTKPGKGKAMVVVKQERLNNDEFLTRLAKLLEAQSSASHGSIHLSQKRVHTADGDEIVGEQETTTTEAAAAAAEPLRLAAQFADRQLPQNASGTDTRVNGAVPAILVRATNGKPSVAQASDQSLADKQDETARAQVKIATLVAGDDVQLFFARYADVCRAGMLGLKKRDRSKNKKKAKKVKSSVGTGTAKPSS